MNAPKPAIAAPRAACLPPPAEVANTSADSREGDWKESSLQSFPQEELSSQTGINWDAPGQLLSPAVWKDRHDRLFSPERTG